MSHATNSLSAAAETHSPPTAGPKPLSLDFTPSCWFESWCTVGSAGNWARTYGKVIPPVNQHYRKLIISMGMTDLNRCRAMVAGNDVLRSFLTLCQERVPIRPCEALGAGVAIKTEPRPKDRNAAAMDHLRRLNTPLPFDMKLILERDAVLKLALLLPEDVLSEALLVGRALQACAKHRHTIPEGREGDCRKP